ncbi:hypothetical protein [Propionimicrobium sp. PCR01-08-3]|uniref:alpha/beta fold hydrolase n=1 Tax=Propionimicrobium sp. PCR01-08-3 TaxID=3052086 RepID=UPI00255CF76C|nr:hypothetical protein [Propionimicrobium sp. PCR01-08-3]WIY84023.1 hypothetical protein QQ658_06715 [Propionimicrobium sp. PCR01-08-3]
MEPMESLMQSETGNKMRTPSGSSAVSPASSGRKHRAGHRRGSRGKTIVKVLAIAVVAGLVVDKAISIISPSPQVGRWKSAAAKAAYASAYDQAMAALPEPTRIHDVQVDLGSVRVLEWQGSEPGPPVVLLPGRSSGAPMWIENLPDWIGQRTIYALDPLGDAGFSAQTVPLTSFRTWRVST